MVKQESRAALIGRLKAYVNRRLITPDGVENESAIIDLAEKSSDRVTALTFCIVVEDYLRYLIEVNIANPEPKLFADFGLFGSFNARISAAYALGLIDKTCADDLYLIRNLRNAAAHSISAFSFDEPDVKNVVQLFFAMSKMIYKRVGRKKNVTSIYAVRYMATCMHYAILFYKGARGPHPLIPTAASWPSSDKNDEG